MCLHQTWNLQSYFHLISPKPEKPSGVWGFQDKGLPLVEWSYYLVMESKGALAKYQYQDKVV